MVRKFASTMLLLTPALASSQTKGIANKESIRGTKRFTHRDMKESWQGVDLFDEEYLKQVSQYGNMDDDFYLDSFVDDWQDFSSFGDLGDVLGLLGDQVISDDALSLFTIGESMIHHR